MVTKITCYVHCYYQENYLLSVIRKQRKVLVLFTVITKKITYVHCYLKENNYLVRLLLLQVRLLVMLLLLLGKQEGPWALDHLHESASRRGC